MGTISQAPTRFAAALVNKRVRPCRLWSQRAVLPAWWEHGESFPLPARPPSCLPGPAARLPPRRWAQTPSYQPCIHPSLISGCLLLNIHLLLCKFSSQPQSLSGGGDVTRTHPKLL